MYGIVSNSGLKCVVGVAASTSNGISMSSGYHAGIIRVYGFE